MAQDRAISKYEKPRMELANNGLVINCGINYAPMAKTNDPYSCSSYDNLEFVFGFDETDKAFAKFMELGKLAGVAMEGYDNEEEKEAGGK